MTFIKKTPFTWLALATYICSRFIIIHNFGPHITDVYVYLQMCVNAFEKDQKAYQDFLWSYPPLSLTIVYFPYLFRHDFDGYRLAFQLTSCFVDCFLIYFLAAFLKDRLQLSAKAVTVGVCSYSLLSIFQGHLIFDRIDVFLVLTFVMGLYYMGDKRDWPGIGAAVLGVLWKVMPIFWMPVLGVMRFYERGKAAFIKSILIAVIPTSIVLIGWDTYVNGHMFETLQMHSNRGIQIESTWASVFMVWKQLNPAAAIEIANNNGAQHLAGADLPEWVVSLSKVLGFMIMGVFYLHFLNRIYNIRKSKRAKTFNYYVGGFFAMSAPYLLFVATQRVLSTQYFEWSLPAVCILFAMRPKIIDFIMVTVIYACTSIEFDGITLGGKYYGYWNYVKFDPLITWDMALRNLLLVIFVARFTLLYRDYFSEQPKYF